MGYFAFTKVKDRFLLSNNEQELIDRMARLAVEDRCLAKSAPDEPLFVLRAQDITSPDVVRFWLDNAVAHGMDPNGAKAEQARKWIDVMREWQSMNATHVPD